MVEVIFPQTLYTAELYIPSSEDSAGTPSGEKRKFGKRKSRRDIVREALSQLGLKFAVDWEPFEKKIITFHDLSDSSIPLSKIVDGGTVTSLSPEEFYDAGENQEWVFKSLLRKCLQQKLYPRQVLWQNDKGLFIFVDKDGGDIREEHWQGLKSSGRTVFERTRKTEKPEETWYCKHLAFESQFRRINNHWYLLIKPEWFFSYDGYKESFYAPEKVDWLKRMENNLHVYNHFRFLVYFITHDEPSDLFRKIRTYPYLSFGDTVSFSTSPWLDDSDWNPPKDSSEGDAADDDQESQMSLL
jgi:hypothetical protein